MDEFANKQAPAILMPFLREAISTATAKSRFGQLLLPPLNVVAITEEIVRAEAESKETVESPES